MYNIYVYGKDARSAFQIMNNGRRYDKSITLPTTIMSVDPAHGNGKMVIAQYEITQNGTSKRITLINTNKELLKENKQLP